MDRIQTPEEAFASDDTPIEEEAVIVVDAEDAEAEAAASQAPKVAESMKQTLKKQTEKFVGHIKEVAIASPEFRERVAEISRIGGDEQSLTATHSRRLLEHTVRSSSKDSANNKASKQIMELRQYINDSSNSTKGMRKFLASIPFIGSKMRDSLDSYQSNSQHLEAISEELLDTADNLLKDNSALEQEAQNLYSSLGQMNETLYLLNELIKETKADIAAFEAAGDYESAKVYENDVLLPLNQKRADTLTNMGVASQGYMQMGIIHKTNKQLIHGIHRTRTTTVAAMEISLAIHASASQSQNVLDALDAVDQQASELMKSSAEMLHSNVERTGRRAMTTGISAETLEAAFGSIMKAVDSMEATQKQANLALEAGSDKIATSLRKIEPALRRVEALGGTTTERSAIEGSGGNVPRLALGGVSAEQQEKETQNKHRSEFFGR